MRRTLSAFLMLFFALFFMLLGCQKENRSLTQFPDLESSVQFSLAEAKAWFDYKKQNELVSKRDEEGNLFSTARADWGNATIFSDREWQIVELPVSFDRSIGFNDRAPEIDEEKPNKTKILFLIFKNKNDGRIRPVLMHVNASAETDIQNVSYKTRNIFSGTILFTTIDGRFINGWKYDKSKIIASISHREENAASRMELPGDECSTIQIDWYERTCTLYSNNAEICSGWTYTHTTYQTVCTGDGSGSGGGEGGTTPPDDQNCTEVKESMAGHAVSIPESISLISENTSAQTPTRTKAYVWVLYQQNWGLWSFSSHEEGVHKKNGTNWQWQSLTHKSISRSGLFAGGTVNCEVNTSIPEIGVYNAGMQLNYTITISVLCKGSPLGASGTYTTNSPIWNVND